MDQVKEYLRLAVKYRFWIIVGVAAILPIAGYFASAGALDQQATAKTNEIVGAEKDVKPFQNGELPIPRWKELTDEKTKVLTGDVNVSWRKLYERQAPLLDWPPQVEDKFKAWGDGWPKDVDANEIELVINSYVQVYPEYVTKVYKSFEPWDPESGEGLVVAPPEMMLLRPAVFDQSNPPTLGKVHVAQKRLWIQRTMLDIIESVNKKAGAKDWDHAWVKRITALEVASPLAQDQRSAADGLTLEPPVEPTNPNAPAPATDTASAPSGGGSGSGAGPPSSGGYGGSGAAGAAEAVLFIAPKPGQQYDIVPVSLGVLIDQEHMADLLVEFENSPMSIQVVDFDFQRPLERVAKPIKGEAASSLNSGFGSNIGGSQSFIGGGMMGYGGLGKNIGTMLGGSGSAGGPPSRMGYGPGAGGMLGPEGGSGVLGAAPARKGTSRLTEIEKAEKEKKDAAKNKGADKKKAEVAAANTIADPYYNIVEVHIYGQARFYKQPPPPEAAPPASPGEAPAANPAEPAKDAAAGATEPAKDAAPAADATKSEPSPEAKKDEAKKDEAKKDEAKKDEAKKDEAKAAPAPGEAKKDAAPAPDQAKKGEDAPKAEAKGAEPSTTDTTKEKGEPSKDQPKPDASGTPKP